MRSQVDCAALPDLRRAMWPLRPCLRPWPCPSRSSSHAIAGALETMAKRLQGVLDEPSEVTDLSEALDEDYESLDELSDEMAASDEDSFRAVTSAEERGERSEEHTSELQSLMRISYAVFCLKKKKKHKKQTHSKKHKMKQKRRRITIKERKNKK